MKNLNTNIFLISVITIFILCTTVVAQGVTLSIDTTSAMIGDQISATADGTMNGATIPPAGTLRINFGDGSPVQKFVIPFGNATPYTFTATHSYTQSGTYTITATAIATIGNSVPLPASAQKKISILNPIQLDLPRGTVGDEYKHTFTSTNNTNLFNFRIEQGRLAPGLELDRYGRVTGIPTQKGSFPFTLSITTSQKLTFSQNFTLYIDPGILLIETTPETINISQAGRTNQKVTFTVVKPTVPINETISSPRGEFYLGGKMVGYNNKTLRINLNQPNPSATETIKIPQSVLQAVQSSGINKVRYRRSFRPNNLRPGYAETKVNIRTAASGELRITKLRIYFEQNNRPLIMVERNERDLAGTIDIHYNGSGTFKGYWKVDERIIQRVQKNVFYGKVMTLKTPKTPPLPTYSEGAHHLQFIITEPKTAQEKIDFPEAIYHVEAKRAAIVAPIVLTSPENAVEFDSENEPFTWSEVTGTTTYLVEFFEEDAEKLFFSAYAKKGSYKLHPRLLNLKFVRGNTYEWQVKGFNNAGELNAESSRQSFSLPGQTTYVPGQVIFLVDNNDAGRTLIEKFQKKYNLQILDQIELTTINQIMIICTTENDVHTIMKQLKEEKGIYNTQPNYIFSTYQQKDPLRSMQTIDELINFDRIHQKLTGKNILIAVIDTGVDINHQDLQKRIQDHHNFISGSDYSGEIHGTGIAGVIAGARNDFGIIGIAPDSQLLVYRACKQLNESSPQGECYSSSIAKAIDMAISMHANVINLSLGTTENDKLITLLINKGHEQKITFVAPVGNNSKTQQVAFPASHPNVIGVAGLGKNNTPLPNKSLALKADTVAPANNFFSTIPGDKHNFFEGTSFSAATISGIIALSIEKNNGTPSDFSYPHFDVNSLWQDQVTTYMGL